MAKMPIHTHDVDILHIASLARLRLGEAEAREMAEQLGSILDHMEALREVDTSGIEPGGGGGGAAPLRPDEPGADRLERGPAEIAPAWEDGFFVVPRLAALDTEESP